MIFTINRDTLLNNLIIMQRALPARTSLPILNNIKFDVREDHIVLTTNNTDIAIQVIVDGDDLNVVKTGNVVISGKFLIDIVRKVSSKNIEFTLIEDRIIIIKADRSEFKLRLMDVLDYPEVDFLMIDDEPLVIDSDLLKTIIKETSYAAASSEKRPILTGVNLNFFDNHLEVVATNSYRLAKKEIKLRSKINNFNVVIPSKSLDELSKILDVNNNECYIYVSANKVLFKIDNILYQTSLLEGTYPNTSRIIPTEFPVIVPFNKEELIQTVERVSLLSPKDKETNYNIIKFKLNNDHSVEITSTNQEVGDANEVILPSGDVLGQVLNIAFSSRHLIDALKTFNTSEVILNFAGEVKPFTVTSKEEQSLLHLILPVRID